MSLYQQYASVVLDVSLEKSLTYGIPNHLISEAVVGTRVEVPLQGTKSKGTITKLYPHTKVPRVRPITKVLEHGQVINDDLFSLAQWMASYYCCSLQKTMKVFLPAPVRSNAKQQQQLFVTRNQSRTILVEECKNLRNTHSEQSIILDQMLQVKKGIYLSELLEKTGLSRSPVQTLVKKGFLNLQPVFVDKNPLDDAEYFTCSPKVLSKEQAKSLEMITTPLQKGNYAAILLFGVTGSGKTEVYLQAIEKALGQNKSSIVLVPEIALTAQTIERFKSRFKEKIAIIHHRLSKLERLDQWMKIREGTAKIVIGPRSAVFSPVQNLGLIIVDEEHDASFIANEEAPCYSAKDVAIMRAYQQGAVVVLGSATPSLESYYNALNGKFALSTLKQRPKGAHIPKVTIIDMKKEYEKNGGYTNFSSALINGIQERIQNGEQSILFLNRRGYHTTLSCKGCGTPVCCQHCSTSLTFHKNSHHLCCHLCGYGQTPPKVCPHCQTPNMMKFSGVGTEQIEKSLHAILPDCRTMRIDADTTRHKGSHQKLIRQFRSGKADVLIGTQMVAKGLHFPQVTLVGVIDADQLFTLPDFRASERAFQLLTQVAGRSGRSDLTGEVIVQTKMPDNTTIQHAARQDYQGFYEEELRTRQLFDYPPFTRIAKFRFSGDCEKSTHSFGVQFHQMLSRHLNSSFSIHPLIPSGYAKIKDRYYYQFIVIGNKSKELCFAYETTVQSLRLPRGVKILADIDTQSIF